MCTRRDHKRGSKKKACEQDCSQEMFTRPARNNKKTRSQDMFKNKTCPQDVFKEKTFEPNCSRDISQSFTRRDHKK